MNRRSFVLAVIIVATLLALAWTRTSWHRPPRFVSITEDIMASPITVTAPENVAGEAAALVFAIFRHVDDQMSEWKPTSPLTAVNRAAGSEAISVPPELRAVIRRGIEIGEMTDGAFDITWGALWGLWDFKAARPELPDAALIRQRAALVDFRRIEIDDAAGTVRLPQEGMLIGLGGIAKGYALDRAARVLRERGIEDFLISAAGQVMLGGHKDGRPWRVGVRDPRGPVDDFFASLELTNVSVSTSGDYERAFMLDGTRYHHILDPRTGWPTRGVRSATVISSDATLADALSTAIMVMGREHGLELINEIPATEALIVDEHGQVHRTAGLAGAVHVHHPPAPDGS